jgi:hypothetical protein
MNVTVRGKGSGDMGESTDATPRYATNVEDDLHKDSRGRVERVEPTISERLYHIRSKSIQLPYTTSVPAHIHLLLGPAPL